MLKSPDGYKFYIIDEPLLKDKDPVKEVRIGVSDLKKSLDFWHTDLEMELSSQNDIEGHLNYKQHDIKLILQDMGGPIP